MARLGFKPADPDKPDLDFDDARQCFLFPKINQYFLFDTVSIIFGRLAEIF